jgi:hypothetical protein
MARRAAPATLTAHHDCEFREVLDRPTTRAGAGQRLSVGLAVSRRARAAESTTR